MKKLVPYILFAGVIDLLAVVFYLDTLRMPKSAYQMPRILIVLVLILSTFMIGERVLQLRKAPPVAYNDAVSGNVSVLRIAVFVLLLFAYVMTIKPLGYFIATPAFLIGSLVFLRSTKLPWIMAIAVGFTGFVYLLFVLFLHMPVPMGLLE